MAGKPSLPDTRGGLAALDQEREASMADEGGASGAAMEGEDSSYLPPILHDSADTPGRRRRAGAFVAGAAAGVFAAMWMVRRRSQ
jgi:hypothetical protein